LNGAERRVKGTHSSNITALARISKNEKYGNYCQDINDFDWIMLKLIHGPRKKAH